MCFASLILVLGANIPAVFAMGSCSNLSFSSNPPPGNVTVGTTITFTGTGSCTPAPGNFQILVFSGVRGSSNGTGSVTGSWVASNGYGANVTAQFLAYASDNTYSPAKAELQFTIVAAGQSAPPPVNNNPPPANNGNGNTNTGGGGTTTGGQQPQQPSGNGGSNVNAAFASAQQGATGINFANYCALKFGAEPYAEQGNALSLSCKKDGQIIALRYNTVCKDIYTNLWYMNIGNMSDSTSLSCGSIVRGDYSTNLAGAVTQGGSNPAPQPQQPVAPKFPNAQSNGGVNVLIICQDWGYSREEHSDSGNGKAYSYRCPGEPTLQMGKAQFEKACQDAYGLNYHATLNDASALDGWKCVTQLNPYVAPNPPPSSNGGSGTGGSGGGGTTGGTTGGATGGGDGGSTVTCNLASRLVAGKEGHVLSATLNLRAGTGTDFGTILSMQRGDYFTVNSGPTCRQAYNWWYVSFMGRNGYIAEGLNGAYYAEPANPATGQGPTTSYGIPVPFEQMNAWANALAAKFPSKHTMEEWYSNIAETVNFISECKSSAQLAVIMTGVAIATITTGGTATTAATLVAAAFLANTTIVDLFNDIPGCVSDIPDMAQKVVDRLTR